MAILTAFNRFPKEAKMVGHLLAAYANLEIDLLHCVAGIRGDFDAVLKSMFRTRSVRQRIDIADALGRQPFHHYKMGTPFAMAIGAVRHCLNIRNQYAHCNWYDDNSGHLAFVNLEE